MFRMTYAQNKVQAVERAGVGMYPSCYVQRDPVTWTPSATAAPFPTIGLGIGCPSQRNGRTPVYAGERYVNGVSVPGVGECFYGDYQALHDGEMLRTLLLAISVATDVDANWWYRGPNQTTSIVIREVNAAFDTVTDGADLPDTTRTVSAAGGTRWEGLDVAMDPTMRYHALLAALEVDVAAYSEVASTAGNCDLGDATSYWQTGREARLWVWETWDWTTWTLLGMAWAGSVAAHPYATWATLDYPVMLEWHPSGMIAAGVSYATTWGEELVNCRWPKTKHVGETYYHKGYAPTGQVHEFARVAAYQSFPWSFAAVGGWTPVSMVE